MKPLSMLVGVAAGSVVSLPALATALLIDNFDVTVGQSIPNLVLGGDLVGINNPVRTPPTSVVYFDIASVTNPGDPQAPIGGFRGLTVTQGSPGTFVSVLRRADVPGFDPALFPGTLGFQVGAFNTPPFTGQIIWDGGPAAALTGGLNADIQDFGFFELETFVVDLSGASVDVKILVEDEDGNVSSLTRSGLVSGQRVPYELALFTADPIGTGQDADFTDVFSIAIEFSTDIVGADFTLDIATLQLIPEPLSLAGFGLGLALVGLALRRRA